MLAGACTPAAGPAPTSSPAADVTVAAGPGDTLTFGPDVVHVPPHSTVRITLANGSSQAHNLTFQSPISVATRTIVEAGSTDTLVIQTPGPGSYEFVCTIHMGMTGTLEVT
jgi:plastocyanin